MPNTAINPLQIGIDSFNSTRNSLYIHAGSMQLLLSTSFHPGPLTPSLYVCFNSEVGSGGYIHCHWIRPPLICNKQLADRKILKGYLLSSQHPWGAMLGPVITGNIFYSASFWLPGWEAHRVGHGNHSSFSWAIVTLMRSILIAIRTVCSRWSHMECGHLEAEAEKGLLSTHLCTWIFKNQVPPGPAMTLLRRGIVWGLKLQSMPTS